MHRERRSGQFIEEKSQPTLVDAQDTDGTG
jgi:hypothetical protein